MRIDYRTVFPAALAAMTGLEQAVHSSSLEAELLELVKLRASQINRCGYCADMHSKDATAIGVDSQRLHVLVAWREAPFYSVNRPGYSGGSPAWERGWNHGKEAGRTDEVSV